MPETIFNGCIVIAVAAGFVGLDGRRIAHLFGASALFFHVCATNQFSAENELL